MKVLVLFSLLAVTGVMSQSAVTYSASVGPIHAPSYEYAYNVNDPSTGDNKHHQEVRHGDAVSGSYSVVEADGTRRIVDYTADDNGYNANVHHEGHAVAPIAHEPVVPTNTHVVSAYAHPYAYNAYPHAYSAYPYAYNAYPQAYSAYSYAYNAHPYAYNAYPNAYNAYPYNYIGKFIYPHDVKTTSYSLSWPNPA